LARAPSAKLQLQARQNASKLALCCRIQLARRFETENDESAAPGVVAELLSRYVTATR